MEMTREETITLYKALQAHGVEIERDDSIHDRWWPHTHRDDFSGSKCHYRIKGSWRKAYTKAQGNGLKFEELMWYRKTIRFSAAQECYRIAKSNEEIS